MISVRIYNNGSYVVNNVRPEHLEDHIKHNTTFRFGCALVVGGEIKNKGYLDEDRIMTIYESIDINRFKSYTELPYN